MGCDTKYKGQKNSPHNFGPRGHIRRGHIRGVCTDESKPNIRVKNATIVSELDFLVSGLCLRTL